MKLWIRNILQNIVNRIESEEDKTLPEDYFKDIIMKSTIEWKTGEPKENDIYLVTTSSNTVRTSYWNNGCWLINNLPFGTLKIKAWYKISDIEPYKED